MLFRTQDIRAACTADWKGCCGHQQSTQLYVRPIGHPRMSPGPRQLEALWISISGFFWSILMWDRKRNHLHWLRGKYQLTSIQSSVQGPTMSWGTAAEHKASVWLTEPENSHHSSSQRLHSLPVSFRLGSSLSEPLLDKPQLTSGLFGFDLCWLHFEALLILSVTAAIN